MDIGGIDSRRLYAFVKRIEHVQQEVDAANEDKAEIYKEAKSDGFDTNVIKAVLKRRRNGKGATEEADARLTMYERAIENEEGGSTSRSSRRRTREADAPASDAPGGPVH